MLSAVVIAIALQSAAAEGETSMRSRNGEVRVLTAGAEQQLNVDGTLIARPFGAELVDRLSITGRQRVGDDDVFIVRGSRGSECPARYVAVTVPPRGSPRVSTPFGDCEPITASSNRRGRLTVTTGGAAARRYLYQNGEMRLTNEAGSVATAAVPSFACMPYRAGSGEEAARQQRLDAFSATAETRLTAKALARAPLAPEELTPLLSEMACLDAWPESDGEIARLAAPLFRSRRQGREAFAALEALARNPAASETLRAAARGFAASMRFEVSLERFL